MAKFIRYKVTEAGRVVIPAECAKSSASRKATKSSLAMTSTASASRPFGKQSARRRFTLRRSRLRRYACQRSFSASGATKRRVSEAVLDASALLAFLRKEPSGKQVQAVLGRSMISTVNLAEVVAKKLSTAARSGGYLPLCRSLRYGVVPFATEEAFSSGPCVL